MSWLITFEENFDLSRSRDSNEFEGVLFRVSSTKAFVGAVASQYTVHGGSLIIDLNNFVFPFIFSKWINHTYVCCGTKRL